MVNRVTIVGLGLIGGSLGLALKKARGKDWEVVGYSRNFQRAAKAVGLGAVDRVENSLSEAVESAEMVIIATPVMAIREILQQLGECLPPGCIVTDTASTKLRVMKWAEEFLSPRVNFVGGHPMAGKELSGIEAAEVTLFEGCTYCLTPRQSTSPSAVEMVAGLIRRIGARPLFIEASQHDYLVAGISHLPLVLSSALVSATTGNFMWREMSRLAAGGYRDVTRLVSQDPVMNRDICLTNSQNIANWIDDFIAELQRFRRLILAEESSGELEQAFVQVQRARQEWLRERGYGKKA